MLENGALLARHTSFISPPLKIRELYNRIIWPRVKGSPLTFPRRSGRDGLLRRKFYCANCRRSTQLVPRCQFEVTVTDQSGSTTATISDEHAENILLLTSEELYNICNVEKELPPLVNAQKQLTGKIFNFQMKKLFTKNHDAVPGKLVISSFMAKGNPASQTPSTIKDLAEGSKRKIEHVGTGEQEHPQTTNKGKTSYNKHKVEMKIPLRKGVESERYFATNLGCTEATSCCYI